MDKDLDDILNEFREVSNSTRDMGDKFERFIKSILVNDTMIGGDFSEVFMWSDWPYRGKEPDTGIDLVGVEADTGNLVAIQCKFHDKDNEITKKAMDSFLSTSSRKYDVEGKKVAFTRRLVVSTTDKWNINAERVIQDQNIPVNRLGLSELQSCIIDWSKYSLDKPEEVKFVKKNELRKHQKEALEAVERNFKDHDRGKLIMACGTGKTYTSLKITEHLMKDGDWVLFLVPSISLLSQTLREWTAQKSKELNCFAVCSDIKAGKKIDDEDMRVIDLSYPATTDMEKLSAHVKKVNTKKKINIVFSTYQSIQVVADAQKKVLPEFNLIICDEAHRTTGVELKDKEASPFTKVHHNKYIKAKKRLYMTATPKIYGEKAQSKAKEVDALLCHMDDENLYGPEFHRLGFSEAVKRGLLTDYKVLVLAVDENYVNKTFQSLMTDEENKELKFKDDIVKIIGCWNGLAKKTLQQEDGEEIDLTPMKRAVAFTNTIANSKLITEMFTKVVEKYVKDNGDDGVLLCETDHVDGSMNSLQRNTKIDWLKKSPEESTCKILTNARCLSEGVDVPALDCVMFLNPRNSEIDVVQSVGRVMRRAEGKKYGYVILPIGIPAGLTPEEALKDNKKYKVVWQVLQALRAHDDSFNATVNKIELNKKKPNKVQVIGVGGGASDSDSDGETQTEFEFDGLEEWRDAIYAKLVQKCGDRRYWENWAKDVAKIAENHIRQINKLLEDPTEEHKKAFDSYLEGLRQDINPSVTKDEAIEMLAQHLITKPVFNALFDSYSFTENNPVSKAMEKIVKVLESENIGSNIDELQMFYNSVRERAIGIDNDEGKQQIIIELYDKFFKHAFPKVSDRLGIVYTPVEVVDFILNSVNYITNQEFGYSISDKGINILDPFTGTGTFIVRLLQSGLIKREDFIRKYTNELFANEIVLLAYYIACINIEETFHSLTGGAYKAFDGAVLTDTFQMFEQITPMEDIMFPENNQSLQREKSSKVNIIIGNPPYSVGQKSDNDSNVNLKYEKLEESLKNTYVKYSTGNPRSLYDSYIKAFRWASDRLGDSGVIAFISNARFLDSVAADGMRKCLKDEFFKIYIFNLRGNARTQGELRRKEKGNVFGEGTQTPVAITILVKNKSKEKCEIKYLDIGDYLTKEEKLSKIQSFRSIQGIYEKNAWRRIIPNKYEDWINQRDESFEKYLIIGSKKNKDSMTIFEVYSSGVKTCRDSWCYNFSNDTVKKKMKEMIFFYNNQLKEYHNDTNNDLTVEKFVERDESKISWSYVLKKDLKKGKTGQYNENAIVKCMYRPFVKEYLYYDNQFNENQYLMKKIFPENNSNNLYIAISGPGSNKGFSALISNVVPDLQLQFNSQCFPLYYYKDEGENKISKKCSIQKEIINEFKLKIKQDISGEDIFYYIYGILHSPYYIEKNSSSLSKELPRIPLCKNFDSFMKAGRDLAEIHLNYESIEPYDLYEDVVNSEYSSKNIYMVTKMKYSKLDKEEDRSSIIFNNHITLKNIPEEAYKYVVNGRPAIEWLIERYQVKKDKKTKILNDPNLWSSDPRYIIDLVKRVITVSIKTMKIVKKLPSLEEID